MSSSAVGGKVLPRPRVAPKRVRISHVLLYIGLAIMTIPFLFPTWWMISSSFKSVNEILTFPPTLLPLSPTLEGYVQAFTFQPFALQYFNSVYISTVVTAVTLLISTMAGYAFARVRFPGQNAIFLVVLSGLLVPSEVT